MSLEEIIECCPHCNAENQFLWDVDSDGYTTYCPRCGHMMMLCDVCQHNCDNPKRYCDWNITGCFRSNTDLKFKLGLYDQYGLTDKGYGIALQAYENGEPYGVITVNLPSAKGLCEFIGIKNAAYVDTNNYPEIAKMLTQTGLAIDTGFTKKSGFCDYPLFVFSKDWLKSLEPVMASRTYDIYEKTYNSEMGMEWED